jgi:hypothetical protein
MPLFPVINGVRIGFASPSISLIQVLLQDSQTSLAFQSMLLRVNVRRDSDRLENHDVVVPGNKSAIHWLTVCSRVNFPVWSQNAHSFIVNSKVRYDSRMKSKPQSAEYKAFESMLGAVLTVSKTELNRRIKQEKSEKRIPKSASRVSAVPSKPS